MVVLGGISDARRTDFVVVLGGFSDARRTETMLSKFQPVLCVNVSVGETASDRMPAYK